MGRPGSHVRLSRRHPAPDLHHQYVEGYHRQLRKVLKTKSSFPTEEAARKLLFLVTQDIARKWSGPIFNWPLILNQLAIRYEDRLSFG